MNSPSEIYRESHRARSDFRYEREKEGRSSIGSRGLNEISHVRKELIAYRYPRGIIAPIADLLEINL